LLVVYNIFIVCYQLAIRLLAFKNKKAKEWIIGRENWQHALQHAIGDHKSWIWMHCASAGEFEQGKPVIENLKKQFPDVKVVVSFFSPSGFGIAKKYKYADHVTYLPLDTSSNAKDFIHIVQPKLVVFVKYDYWYHHLKTVKENGVPLLLVSAIFREGQPFFKWYGGLHREMLGFFSQIFVQDAASAQLLTKVKIDHYTISGDTRFDRVSTLTQELPQLEIIEAFRNGQKVIVAGSTWPEDENLLQKTIAGIRDLKVIIAPHEINRAHIAHIQSVFPEAILFSEATKSNTEDKQVLIIDNVGMLSRLYYYATVTYIGGGFNKSGIHNTLEAAVWGKPVFFGPNFQKFKEAKELIARGGALSVSDSLIFNKQLTQFLADDTHLQRTGEIAREYVMTNIGATEKIIRYIRQNVF